MRLVMSARSRIAPSVLKRVRVVAVHRAVEHAGDGLQRDDDAVQEIEARALVDAGAILVELGEEFVE